jgi:hypothetical protein
VEQVEQGAYWAGYFCENTTTPYAQIWATDLESFYQTDSIAQQESTVDGEWHTYRMEVQGNALRLYVDGDLVVETGDLRYVDPGQVGLWGRKAQVDVRSFRVLAL